MKLKIQKLKVKDPARQSDRDALDSLQVDQSGNIEHPLDERVGPDNFTTDPTLRRIIGRNLNKPEHSPDVDFWIVSNKED